MLVEAIQTVHTSGINWESVATILGGFAAATSVLLRFATTRATRREDAHIAEMKALRSDIRAVTVQVGNLNTKVARVEGKLEGMRGRMSRPD